jgi:peptidoglycan/LPS O-acetylase OafA/YrhL
MEKISYRPDIDGLRAIAVLAVLVFHTDKTLLSGGFVGVDIFFVISGYLITSIIINNITNKEFSLYHFYDRRIRRIIPALFFFLSVISIASYFILFPDDLYKYAKSLLGALFFFSNIYFWRNSGYFAPTSDTIPLLHTWSLSIEEQFYLFFPAFIILVVYFSKKNIRKNIVVLLGVIFIISFAVSVWGAENKPSATFYLLPTRAWELLLGSLLVFSPKIKPYKQYRSLLTGGGIIVILMSFYFLSKELSFPGKNALFPCLGAGMIILANHKNKENFVSKFISIKPLVFIGLISYSLYLWHWAFIVFYKYYTLEKPSLVIVLLFSFIVAIFSWKFIEKPFRETDKKRLPYFSLFLVGLGLIIFSYLIYLTKGIPERLPDKLSYMSMGGIKELKNPYRKRCFTWGEKGIPLDQVWKKACRLGESTENMKESFVLIGDSHSDALFTGIDSMAKKAKLKGIFLGFSGCNPVQGMFRKRKSKCEEFKKVFYEEIYKHKSIKLVVFSSRWASSLYGNTYGLGPAEPIKTPVKSLLRLSDKPKEILNIKEREKYFSLKMKETILSLLHSGKKVVLFASIPEVGYHVPRYMARKEMSSINIELVRNKKYFYSRQKFILNLFSKFSKINGVSVLYPHEKLCIKKGDTCMYQIDGKPLYYDDDHLSIYGADYIAPMIEDILKAEKTK